MTVPSVIVCAQHGHGVEFVDVSFVQRERNAGFLFRRAIVF